MIWQIWFQNRQKKNRPQKTKAAQKVVFNMKSRILLLFYCVKHIHGQFKFKTPKHQTNSKNYPDCWEKPCRDILLI
jgi:hypothetical protein